MPIVLNGSGPVTGVTSLNTTVSDTEIGYLDGVTSAIQSQINTAGGLVKITDQAFSASSAVNVNSCFTSTYSSYLIIAAYKPNADSDRTVTIRYRASGSDNTANLYRTTTGTTQTGYTSSHSLGNAYYQSQAGSYGFALTLVQPQEAAATKGYGSVWAGTAGDLQLNSLVTYHDSLTQFDGFSVITSTSTLTGTLRVYGFRN